MSEDLLHKFISEIEQEEDIGQARVKAKKARKDAKRGQSALAREEAKIQLKAAARGATRLPADEAYLAQGHLETGHVKGVSLIEEARQYKAVDYTERNKKYIKYTEKLRLDEAKVSAMVQHHKRRQTDNQLIRDERASLTGLREPKKGKKRDAGSSIFSAEDFARLKKIPKKKTTNEDGVFM